jgi:site-specific DNA recombinase
VARGSTQNPKPRPAFGYVRVSSLEDGQQGSMPMQRRAIGQIAELRGFEIVEWFEDPDLSAFKRNVRRPGYDEMMLRLPEIAGGGIVFYRLDRFCRRLAQFAAAYERCDDHRVALVSATEPVDTSSPMGLAAMEMLMVFAGLEARTTQARLRDHHANLAVEGKHHGGPLPFGWAYNASTKTVTVDDAEAVFVVKVCERFVAGWSAKTIIDTIRTGIFDGVPVPPRAAHWDHVLLRQVLRQRRLTGARVHKGKVVAEGAFPEIVPRALHDRVLAVYAANSNPGGRAASLLGGLLRCGSCGNVLHRYPMTNRKLIYGCSARGRDAPVRCTQTTYITADVIEPWILDRVFAHIAAPDIAVRLTAARKLQRTTVSAHRRATALRERLERAEHGYVEGLIPEARFRSMREKLLAELEPLELASASPTVLPTPSAAYLAALPGLWEYMTEEEQRTFLRMAFDAAHIPRSGPGGRRDMAAIRIDWRF